MKQFFSRVLLLLVIFSLTLTSCASILNGKHQKVTIKTASSDSKVYVDGELRGTGKNVVTKIERNRRVKQIMVEREGYKPDYKVHYQDRKSPWYIMSWIPFGVLLYPPFMDYGPKAYNYPKELSVGKNMPKIQTRAEDEKYVYLRNTAFDVKKEDIKYTSIKNRNYKKKKDKYKNIDIDKEDLKFDNSVFSETVTEILEKNNYIDTTKTIFKSNTNSLYISAKVTKVRFEYVYAYEAKTLMNFIISKLDIEWEIYDLYNQPKYKKSYKSESGQFRADEDAFKNSVEDAISASFFEFMSTETVKELIKQQESKELKLEKFKITKPTPIAGLEQAMEATVTIKGDKGHGSGCFISNDGYIITNFHVVAANDKITVITKDGKELTATIVRKTEYSDLALIKVDTTSEFAFTLPTEKNYKIGEDIFAIGTPKSIELGQSLSKGIISGFRTYEDNKMIQTDASVNGGNSGGALVNKNGDFIGVVNAKVFGVGVEGLGFSIPAETIFEDLNITY
ncbi:S1C family serine protease [Flavobacterium litorale]|uniref:Trypsin-like peptidase domain-containing protein n=1 Tax=Flavobacterium litorale TaxID=2856519 RepID=A0ABX8VBL7_9FLAO|nr:trypsin-like peptidase domain-containing protein [Flavobacterium litorale]QYJ68578.1 trypsin-like peptidase domain-containing protein [Flavobacterium litorale]